MLHDFSFTNIAYSIVDDSLLKERISLKIDAGSVEPRTISVLSEDSLYSCKDHLALRFSGILFCAMEAFLAIRSIGRAR